MVVVSHLFSFSWINFRGRRDPHGTHLPLCRAIYFPTAPLRSFVSFRHCELPQRESNPAAAAWPE